MGESGVDLRMCIKGWLKPILFLFQTWLLDFTLKSHSRSPPHNVISKVTPNEYWSRQNTSKLGCELEISVLRDVKCISAVVVSSLNTFSDSIQCSDQWPEGCPQLNLQGQSGQPENVLPTVEIPLHPCFWEECIPCQLGYPLCLYLPSPCTIHCCRKTVWAIQLLKPTTTSQLRLSIMQLHGKGQGRETTGTARTTTNLRPTPQVSDLSVPS